MTDTNAPVAASIGTRAMPEIKAVMNAALPRLRRGGRLFYVGAGTSGRVGLQDGCRTGTDLRLASGATSAPAPPRGHAAR